MKSALIITGNLVQDHEYIYPYFRLKEEGFKVTTALKDAKPCLGVLGTNIPSDKTDKNIISYENMKIPDYDLLVIPGGAKSMEYLRQEDTVLEFINAFNKTGKVISSICHGAQMLISAKITKNKKISGYYSIKDDIINSGAEYVDAPSVTDSNIVSCPHYKYLGEWMKETIRLYNQKK
jgi:protease I